MFFILYWGGGTPHIQNGYLKVICKHGCKTWPAQSCWENYSSFLRLRHWRPLSFLLDLNMRQCNLNGCWWPACKYEKNDFRWNCQFDQQKAAWMWWSSPWVNKIWGPHWPGYPGMRTKIFSHCLQNFELLFILFTDEIILNYIAPSYFIFMWKITSAFKIIGKKSLT